GVGVVAFTRGRARGDTPTAATGAGVRTGAKLAARSAGPDSRRGIGSALAGTALADGHVGAGPAPGLTTATAQTNAPDMAAEARRPAKRRRTDVPTSGVSARPRETFRPNLDASAKRAPPGR